MSTDVNFKEELERVKSKLSRTFAENERQEVIKEMRQLEKQQRATALQVTNRNLAGTATAWAQCPGLPDFSGSSDVKAVLTIDMGSGDVMPSFDPLETSQSGRTVRITQNGTGIGHCDFTSGDMDLIVPLHVEVENLPVIGNLARDTVLPLSTHRTVSIPGGTISGAPASSPGNATGTITLVGDVSINIFLFVTAHVQIQIVGILS